MPADGACAGVPIVALHLAIGGLRNGTGGDGADGAAIFADKAARVGENLVAGAGIEGAAAAVGDARIGRETCGIGATRERDAVGSGQIVDIVRVDTQISGELSEARRVGQAGEGIFRGDAREIDGATNEPFESRRCQIASGCRCRARADKDAQPGGTRAGILQTFDFALAHQRFEFIAFVEDDFGVGGAGGERLLDELRGQRGGEFLVCNISCDWRFEHQRPVPPTTMRSSLMVGMPTPTGHALAFFPAGADAFIEAQIVAHHRDILQRLRAIADERCIFDRRSDFAVFDEVGFAGGEDKLAIGDVHLAAAKVHRVKAAFDGAQNVLGLRPRRRACRCWSCAAWEPPDSFRGGSCPSPECPSDAKKACRSCSPSEFRFRSAQFPVSASLRHPR